MNWTRKMQHIFIAFLLSVAGNAQETTDKEMQELFEDAFPKALSFNFYADIISYGPYSDKYCKELGSEAKSHQILKDASLSFLEKETKRINAFRATQESLKANADAKVAAEGNVELIGVEYQLDTHMLIISNLIGAGGMIENRKIISSAIESAELKGLEEFDSFKDEIELCQNHLTSAIKIAKDGCERVEIVETCNEDGSSCETTEVSSPVEGSCLAQGAIPHLTNVVNDYDEFFSQVLPTSLHELGYKNLVTKFERFNTNNIEDGDWKSGVDSCQTIVQNLYKKTGVSCLSLRADGTDEAKWNVPGEGSDISDLYEAVLGRKPEPGGLAYWEKDYKNRVTDEKTKEQVYAEIRTSFINSEEKSLQVLSEKKVSKIPLTAEEKIEFDTLTKLTLERDKNRSESDQICDRLDCKTGVEYEEKFETSEKLIAAADALMKVITENDAEYAYVGGIATEKAKWLDLMIGQSINRIEPLPRVLEDIEKLDKKDLDYSLVVMKQYRELLDIYGKLLQIQDSSSDSDSGKLVAEQKSSSSNSNLIKSITGTNSLTSGAASDSANGVAKVSGDSSEAVLVTGNNGTLSLASLNVGTKDMLNGQTGVGLDNFTTFQTQALGNISKISNAISTKPSSMTTRQLSKKKVLASAAKKELSETEGFSNRSEAIKNAQKQLSSPEEGNVELSKMRQALATASSANTSTGDLNSSTANKSNNRRVVSKRFYKKNGSYSKSRSRSSYRNKSSSRNHESSTSVTENVDENFKSPENTDVDSIYENFLKYGRIESSEANGDEINASTNSIFKIVSKRYLQSGLKRLSSKEIK